MIGLPAWWLEWSSQPLHLHPPGKSSIIRNVPHNFFFFNSTSSHLYLHYFIYKFALLPVGQGWGRPSSPGSLPWSSPHPPGAKLMIIRKKIEKIFISICALTLSIGSYFASCIFKSFLQKGNELRSFPFASNCLQDISFLIVPRALSKFLLH